MKNSVLLPLLPMLMLGGCSHKETELAPQITGLIGTWQLVEPDSSFAVTLQFAYDTNNPPHDVTPFKASGKSSVNNYTVNLFATLDGMLVADELSSSKIAGSSAATAFEQTYFTNLKAVVRYELTSNNRLQLTHGGSLPHIMVYKRVN